MRKKCKNGLHEYVDTTKQLNTLYNGVVVIKGNKKCRFCGKIKNDENTEKEM